MAASANNIACPKCETLLRPPFNTCSDGHLLCKNCRQHINAVSEEPVASATCGDNQFPIPVLNKLLRNLSDKCQYGCGHRANVVDLSDHEDSCLLRSKCAVDSCHWLGELSNLVKHVKDDHPGRLVDLYVVDNNFTLGFEHPVLLLTQWDKTNRSNDLYWLRLHRNENSKFVVMQYEGFLGRKVDKKFLIKEYSVSPVNYPKLSITSDVLFTKSFKDNILKDQFVESQGTDITVCNADKFMVKIKDASPVSSGTLAENLECFICTEIMSGPIRMCVTGHSFCDTCSGKINNKCPKCQKQINPWQRNYALEALTENILPSLGNINMGDTQKEISCKYKRRGCRFSGTDNVDSHAMVCEYQPKTCYHPVGDTWCNWKGSRRTMIDHIQSYHIECIKTIQINHLLPYRSDFDIFYYYFYDNNFFMFGGYHLQRVLKIFFYQLTNETKSNYNFKIDIFNQEVGHMKTFTGCCKFFYKPGVLPAGEITQHYFQHFLLDKDNKFSMMVNICTKRA